MRLRASSQRHKMLKPYKKKRNPNVVKKMRAIRKTIPCGRPEKTAAQSMQGNRAKKIKAPNKKKLYDDKMSREYNDGSSMEVRLLTMVRGKPCARNRMPCDRRKMRRMRLFDPCKDGAKGEFRNEEMLQRAKSKVLKELTRQQALGIIKPSPLEQAFLDATNECFLTIDYDWMKKLVRTARFSNP